MRQLIEASILPAAEHPYLFRAGRDIWYSRNRSAPELRADLLRERRAYRGYGCFALPAAIPLARVTPIEKLGG